MYEDPQPYTNKKISIHIKKERGDFSICPFHDVKALALPCQSETSNADTTPIQRQILCNNQNNKKSRVNTNIYII